MHRFFTLLKILLFIAVFALTLKPTEVEAKEYNYGEWSVFNEATMSGNNIEGKGDFYPDIGATLLCSTVKGFKLNLISHNSITLNNYDNKESIIAMKCSGDITIAGTNRKRDVLTITVDPINYYNLSYDKVRHSFAMHVNGNLTVSNCTLNIVGGRSDVSWGIFANNNIELKNADVNIRTPFLCKELSRGIESLNGNIIVSENSCLVSHAGYCNDDYKPDEDHNYNGYYQSAGIYLKDGSLKVMSGGSVSANGAVSVNGIDSIGNFGVVFQETYGDKNTLEVSKDAGEVELSGDTSAISGFGDRKYVDDHWEIIKWNNQDRFADTKVFGIGWTDSKGTNGKTLIDKRIQIFDLMPYRKISYHHRFNINYELYDGENSTLNPDSYVAGVGVYKLYEAKKEGYEFKGWYGDPDFMIEVTSIPDTAIDDITLYARFEKPAEKNERKLSLRELAILAMHEDRSAIFHYLKLEKRGKKYGLKTSVSGNLTVAKGNKFYIFDSEGAIRKEKKKQVSVSKKGKIKAKKETDGFMIDYRDRDSGNDISVSLNVVEQRIEGGKKLSATVKPGEYFDLPTNILLNAEFGQAKNKGVIENLIYQGEDAIGEDGKFHVSGNAVKPGTVKIPFKVHGKKYKMKIKVKP